LGSFGHCALSCSNTWSPAQDPQPTFCTRDACFWELIHPQDGVPPYGWRVQGTELHWRLCCSDFFSFLLCEVTGQELGMKVSALMEHGVFPHLCIHSSPPASSAPPEGKSAQSCKCSHGLHSFPTNVMHFSTKPYPCCKFLLCVIYNSWPIMSGFALPNV